VTLVSADEPAAEPPGPPSPEEVAAELDAAAEEHAEHLEQLEDERSYPSTIGGAFYLVVLAVSALGIGIVWGGDWRLGIRCLAAGLCFAAVLRLVLPARDAGMLAVRNRFFDALLLGGLGAAIFFLSATIPNQ
jgi:Protein of unknown function (DUF3017)